MATAITRIALVHASDVDPALIAVRHQRLRYMRQPSPASSPAAAAMRRARRGKPVESADRRASVAPARIASPATMAVASPNRIARYAARTIASSPLVTRLGTRARNPIAAAGPSRSPARRPSRALAAAASAPALARSAPPASTKRSIRASR